MHYNKSCIIDIGDFCEKPKKYNMKTVFVKVLICVSIFMNMTYGYIYTKKNQTLAPPKAKSNKDDNMEILPSTYDQIRTVKRKLNDIEKKLAVDIDTRDRNLLLTLSEGYITMSELYRKLISIICKKDSSETTVSHQSPFIIGNNINSNNNTFNYIVYADRSQNTSAGPPPVSKIKVKKVDIPSS